jgi:hypothetical protein
MNIISLRPAGLVPGGANRWLRNNLADRRSRFLLALLAFLIVASGLIFIDSIDAGIRQTLSQRRVQLSRVEQLGRVELWHQRRTESELARVQQEARLWEAETEGIAQANFQSWIIDEAKRAGIGPVDIRLSINPGGGNTLKLRQLSAQIHARFEPAALLKLMQAIAAHDRLLVVERLEVQATATPYFEMLLETYLRPARGA